MITEQGIEPILAYINTYITVVVGLDEQESIVTGNLVRIATHNPRDGGEGELELLFSDRAPIKIHESVLQFADIQALRG